MKIQKLECPYCTGPLDIVRDRVIHYCPHCGKPLAISDESTQTVHKTVYIKKEEHRENVKQIIDAGKIEEEKTERFRLIICGILIIIIFIFIYTTLSNL